MRLKPFSSCWSTATGGICYDGMPPKPRPSLGGTTSPVTLAFPRDHWRFDLRAVDADGESTTIRLVRTSKHSWRLALAKLPDGRYRADIFGRGPQGDVAASFVVFLPK